MKFYRFVSNDIGIYEAVDNDCPREDSRRKLKPDGSWLPKVGTNYPGKISYWTEAGLEKYMMSGLQEWHRSVLNNPLEVQLLEGPSGLVYEDEFQIICDRDQKTKTILWDDFYKFLNQYPMVDKVVAYILEGKDRVLVFEHDKKWSEAGVQVPAGSVDEGENLENAVLREAEEESGLSNLRIRGKIDEYILFRNTHNQFNRRHVFELEVVGDHIQERWMHTVSGDGIDKGMNFTYYWLSLSEAEEVLVGSMGCSIRRLR